MAALAAVSGKALIASTVLSAIGGMASASAARKAGNIEAAGLRREASATRASSQRAAQEELRQARYARSRARAVAAASGAGVQDPTVTRIMADIDAEGAYNALSRLYSGDTEARGMEDLARARKKEGRARSFGSLVSTASTVLSGIDTWKSKYG